MLGQYTCSERASALSKRTEEAERLPNSSIRLLNGITPHVNILEFNSRSAMCEPSIADNHRSKAVYAQNCSHDCEHERRNEMRANERLGRIEAGLGIDAPCLIREEWHRE